MWPISKRRASSTNGMACAKQSTDSDGEREVSENGRSCSILTSKWDHAGTIAHRLADRLLASIGNRSADDDILRIRPA